MAKKEKDLKGKKLKILVKDCKTITWAELKALNFNDLKEAKGRDVNGLVKAIVDDGFLSPFYIWRRPDEPDYVIDGAGRKIALNKVAERGMEIVPLPIVEIEAPDLATAKRYVLMVSSNHGKVTQASFDAFAADIKFDLPQLDSFQLPEMMTGEVSIEPLVWELSEKEVTTVDEHTRVTTPKPKTSKPKETKEEGEPAPEPEENTPVVCPKCRHKFEA